MDSNDNASLYQCSLPGEQSSKSSRLAEDAALEQLRQKAVIVSLISLFANVKLAVAALVCTLLRNSASTTAFAVSKCTRFDTTCLYRVLCKHTQRRSPNY